jgi:hypothetical protein
VTCKESVGFVGAVLLAASPAPVRGAEANLPTDSVQGASVASDRLSAYEREAIDLVTQEHAWRIDPKPEGKQVESFEIVTLDVFEPRDPAPAFLNAFHTKTRTHIIEREILLRRGKAWVKWRATETARRLRNLRQLSLVLVVPVRGSDDRHVRALVITKDVWSLRLNSAWRYKDGRLEYVLLQPSEENVSGTHLRIAGLYVYDKDTNSYGGIVSHPRVLGTHLGFLASSSVVLERATGSVDGTVGSFSFLQPLYASDVKWAYGTNLQWSDRAIRWLVPNANGVLARRTYDSPLTAPTDRLPWEYRAQNWYWITSVTRSFGLDSKQDVSWGLEADRNRYASTTAQAAYDPAAVQDFFTKQVRRSDTRFGPFVRLDAYENKYVSLLNVETLGLQEDFQVGHRVLLKAYTASQAAQSSRDLLGTVAGLSYTLGYNDGLSTVWALHNWEWAGNASRNDAAVQAGVRVVTPTIGPVRIIYDAGALTRYRDYLHIRYALGGDTRLRGYPSQEFIGSNFAVSNLEVRTKPLQLWTVLVGMSGFYDAGGVWDKWTEIQPKHAVGIGIRGLLPQFQRIVGRLECAFPLDRPRQPGEHWGSVDFMLTVEGQPFSPPELVSRGSPLLTPSY